MPDWLSVIDRKVRIRRPMAMAHLNDPDATVRDVSQGVLHHIEDDRWFHGTEAFVQTNLELAVQLRDQLPGDAGFRPMFLGHILIEVFLDAFYIREQTEWAQLYYDIVAGLDRDHITRAVQTITGKRVDRMPKTLTRFLEQRFLYDYLDHDKLLFRMNQVMQRVGLPTLPERLSRWLPDAESLVNSRRERFLVREDGSTIHPPFATSR